VKSVRTYNLLEAKSGGRMVCDGHISLHVGSNPTLTTTS
jgi:hypothetical protein